MKIYDGTAKPPLKAMPTKKKSLREEIGSDEEGNMANHFVITQIEKIYDAVDEKGEKLKKDDRPMKFQENLKKGNIKTDDIVIDRE